MTEKRHQWASNLGFILAAAGSAVGLGNIWKFPGKVGAYGGGAFLIPYFLFVALFSYVACRGSSPWAASPAPAPWARWTTCSGSGAAGAAGCWAHPPRWGWLGIAIGLLGGGGLGVRYAAGSLTGSVLAGDAQGFFSALAVDFGSIPWHFAAVAVTAAILIFGVPPALRSSARS